MRYVFGSAILLSLVLLMVYYPGRDSSRSDATPAAEPAADPWTVGSIGIHNMKPEKCAADFLITPTGDRLPNRDELLAIAGDYHAKNPGYRRYFLNFFLPNMRTDDGCFAAVVYDPDPVVSYIQTEWIKSGIDTIPDRYHAAAIAAAEEK